MSISDIAFRMMPIGLYHAPLTFQRCMMSIFSDIMEDGMEALMADFSVFERTFDQFLETLNKVLQRCQTSNLVLN